MTDKSRASLVAGFSLRTLSRAALGCVLGVTLLAAAAPARAADGDDKNVPIDTKIMRGIMNGLGLRKDGEGITYEERAPLVIPPSRALPPPENPGAAVANNPAWPIDPDVKRAKEEAAQERNVIYGAGAQAEHDMSVLRSNDLTPGPKPRNARRAANSDSSQANRSDYGKVLSPSQLGYRGGVFGIFRSDKDEDVGSFTGEPPRTALTEPPPGYQTPSPDQPYGVGKGPPPKPKDYYLTHGEGER